MDWNDSVMTVKGVGPKTAALMGKLGITTVGELLEYYPVSYDSYEAPVTVRQANFLDFAAVQGNDHYISFDSANESKANRSIPDKRPLMEIRYE